MNCCYIWNKNLSKLINVCCAIILTLLSAQAKNPTVGAQGGTYLPPSENHFPGRIYAYKLHHW